MKRLFTIACALGFSVFGFSQTFISEDFSTFIDSVAPPVASGWKNIDSSAAQLGQTYRFNNPGGFGGPRVLNAPITDPAAIIDSDAYGSGFTQDAYLQSPNFDASTATTIILEFDHYHNALSNTADVEVFDGTSWNIVASFGAASTADPAHETINISSLVTGVANAQVRFHYSASYAWYWIIDNISIYQPAPDDLKALSVDSLVNGCGLSSTQTLALRFTNVGSTPVNNIPVQYSVNGGTYVTETYADTVFPGDTAIHSFTTKANMSVVGNYTISANTNLRGDVNKVNDTTTGIAIHKPLINTFPYSENFETNNGGWISGGTNNSWALGLPAGTVINSASSGLFAWATNLTGLYNANELSYVDAPCFDFTTIAAPQIKMNIWWNSESSWDGAVLQSSIDDGATWQNVGAFGDPNNWYNDNSINGAPGGSQEGWSGRTSSSNGSNGWVLAEHDLSSLGGISGVNLRIAFGSDGFVMDDGFAFDDVLIQNAPASDAGVVSLASPGSDCGLSATDSVRIMLSNFGSSPIDSIPVGFSMNGGTPVNEMYLDTIFPGDTVMYVFASTSVNVSVPGSYTFDIWCNLMNDGNITNDTISNIAVNNNLKIAPYLENFDSFLTGTGNPLLNGWERTTTSTSTTGYSWYANSGQTGSSPTGPSGDHTTGSGNYLYTEASNGGSGDLTTLTSPCIDPGASVGLKLDFWYHMFGTEINTLYIEVGNNNGYAVVDSIVGQQQSSTPDPFLLRSIDISSYLGAGNINVRFSSYSLGCCGGDISIDDFRVYEPQNNDIGVLNFDTPGSGCGLGSADSVRICFKNHGLAAVSNFPLSYVINNGTPVTETFNGTIQPGDTMCYTFTATANLSVAGVYNFDAYTSLTGDGDISNDTAQTVVASRPVISIPFSDDFESGSANIAFEFVTNPESKAYVSSNSANGSLFGLTLEGNSATNYATPNATNVWTTNPEHFASASLCVDLTNVTAAEIKLDLQQGFNFNDFYTNFRITVNGNQVGPDHRPSGATTAWTTIVENISSYVGGFVNISLESMVKYDTLSPNFNFIDNFSIRIPAADDAKALNFTSPNSGCGLGTADSVTMCFANIGSAVMSNFPVSFTLNNGNQVTETYTGSVNPGDTVCYTFTATVDLSTPGTYILDGNISLTGDADATNDSINTTITSIPILSSFPYTEDFENGNGGWISGGSNSSWALGLPANTMIDTAASGMNSWATNLTGTYNASEGSFVQGPCFDFTNIATPVIRMNVWYESEESYDGAAVQSSTDGGVTWQTVGAFGDPTNWYSDTSINGLQTLSGNPHGWAGRTGSGSNGWLMAEHDLTGLGGVSGVLIRIAFGSDGSVQDEGFAFDDIEIDFSTSIDKSEISIENLIIYPNPSNGVITLDFSKENSQVNIEIRDISGKLISEELINNTSSPKQFDLSNLAKGVYFLKAFNSEFSKTEKLIIK
jgi:hypothetical protein